MGTPVIIFVLLILILFIGFKYWTGIILPKQKKIHLQHVNRLITDWFHHIEKNFNRGMNKEYLNNMEGKILKFIDGTALRNVRMDFTPEFQARFLASLGYSKELQLSEDLFKKRAGLGADGIDLHSYWLNLRRFFYQFYWNYTGEDLEKYFDSLEAKVNLFKVYFK